MKAVGCELITAGEIGGCNVGAEIFSVGKKLFVGVDLEIFWGEKNTAGEIMGCEVLGEKFSVEKQTSE
jgi:hypothetical protein